MLKNSSYRPQRGGIGGAVQSRPDETVGDGVAYPNWFARVGDSITKKYEVAGGEEGEDSLRLQLLFERRRKVRLETQRENIRKGEAEASAEKEKRMKEEKKVAGRKQRIAEDDARQLAYRQKRERGVLRLIEENREKCRQRAAARQAANTRATLNQTTPPARTTTDPSGLIGLANGTTSSHNTAPDPVSLAPLAIFDHSAKSIFLGDPWCADDWEKGGWCRSPMLET